MIEKLDNCPVCDKPLSQSGYDMQTCGTHFVGGKIRNHRKPSPVLPAEPLAEWQIDEIAKGPLTRERVAALIADLRTAKQAYKVLIDAASRQSARSHNLAIMLRRFIWQANKLTADDFGGESSLKVLAGKAGELLTAYGLQGSPLRED